jgi:hypothetical protein
MAGYTRNDTGNNIADGNVINAADLDGEFDSIQTAFNETSGHTHDGTVGEGAPISVVGPAQDINVTITEVAPKTTNTMSLGTAALQFKDLYIDGTANIDSLVADTADINGGTIDGTTIGASTPAAITGTSITATGNIAVAGTVDGRDVATDGTKLDTIETNADVTDTANVTAAGALMDSELTNITAVKALDQGVATTDSPSFAGLTATTADINGGTIDGATIATSDITVGAGKTLDVSAGTLTLANDQISGDKVQGGTIGSTTITTLTGTTGNITNVNATTVDTTNIEATNIKAKDGTASATIADATGVMTIASSVLTTTDINGGTIDGVTIGGAVAGAGTFTSVTGTSLDMNGAAVFNESGADVDFRIESDTNANAFFLQGSDGKIGINTGSPLQSLHVNSSGNTQLLISSSFNNSTITGLSVDTVGDSSVCRISASKSGAGRGTLSFLHSSTAALETWNLTAAGSDVYRAGYSEHIWKTGNTERMRITSTGNVGIGTSNPAEKLEVTGNIILDATDANINIKSGTAGTAGAVNFTFNTDSTVYSSLSLPYDTRSSVGLLAQSLNAYPVSIASGTAATATNAVILSTSGEEAMRVDYLGRVGIGDSAPPTILSVRGDTPESRITNTNAISDTGGTEEVARLGVYGQRNTVYGPAANIVFRQDASSWSNVEQYQKGTRIEFCTQDATATDTSETPRMVIDRDGYVGIGTSNPAALLDVDGDALVNGLTVGLGAGSVATNTGVGYQSLVSNTTGGGNSATGYRALYSNTTGFGNSANGYQALYYNDTGGSNIAVGYRALYSNTTGNFNSASGREALYSNTTASGNTADGYQTLYSNTTGGSNLANGVKALYSNTTGNNNTASGYEALYYNDTGGSNTAVGYRALYSNTTGNNNTANGRGALYSNTTGNNNSANGFQALYSNTEGLNNTANGYQVLFSSITGNGNSASGFQALYSNTTGGNNTANGHQALYSNTTTSNNTAIGYRALYSNTTGAANTAMWVSSPLQQHHWLRQHSKRA